MADNEDVVRDFKPDFYMEEVYKKWHRSGFASFKYWVKEDKVQIEIGTIDPKSNARLSFAKAYVDLHQFLYYLQAEVNGTMDILFPDYEAKKLQHFGGSTKDGEVISRVFTSTYWRSNKDAPADYTARAFSCGEYAGKKTASGAVTPIYDKVIQFERIRMSILEIAELHERLRIAANAYAVQRADMNEVYG